MENKDAKKLISEALELYNAGEWKRAINLLAEALDPEVVMHIGWNHWKKSDKDLAAYFWNMALEISSADGITRASAHAGFGIYFAEKGDKEKALYHAKLAQELPQNAALNQRINLNACGISLAKIRELERAEEVLKKAAFLNEQIEKSDDSVLVKKAKHQRAKNGYNLASLIYLPQGRWDEAIRELYEEVIPRYTVVGAETDLAAAYHRMAEAYEKMAETGGIESKTEELEIALTYEKISLVFWQKHPDDPTRIVTSEKNIANIKNKIEKLKQ